MDTEADEVIEGEVEYQFPDKQIIHKLLLTGYHRSVFDKKYYRPLVNCENFLYYVFRREEAREKEMLHKIRSTFNVCMNIAGLF